MWQSRNEHEASTQLVHKTFLLPEEELSGELDTHSDSPYSKDKSISASPDGRNLYAPILEERAVKVVLERREL